MTFGHETEQIYSFNPEPTRHPGVGVHVPRGALSDDARLMSDVCLSVAYIWPKSRTERPRKTKIGIEVAHVTCDSDTTFKVKRLKVTLQAWAGHIVAASHRACHM